MSSCRGLASTQTVPLDSTPSARRGLGCDHTIALVALRDTRTEKALGVKIDDGSYYEPGKPVSDWISRALYDELKQAGCQVEYHDTGAGFGTYYELTGDIEKFWFEERYKTKYNVAFASSSPSARTRAEGAQEFTTPRSDWPRPA